MKTSIHTGHSLVIVLAVILVLGMVTGCSSSAGEPAPTPSQTTNNIVAEWGDALCKSEGETIPATDDPPECCNGLTRISPKTADAANINGICTAKCGDGECNPETERNYNCPEDCLRWDPSTTVHTPEPDNPFLEVQKGKKPVVMGNDGWMFTAPELIIEDVRGDGVVRNLEVYASNLEASYRWLNERGIPYLFVIASNKHSIYAEHLPSVIEKAESTKIDQLLDYMSKNHSEVPILDLRPALLEAKDKYRLYHKTDIHWNLLGANIAQYEIARYLNTIFPDIVPQIAPKEEFYWQEGTGGSLASRLVESAGEFIEYKPLIQLEHLYQCSLTEQCRLSNTKTRTGGYPTGTIITSNTQTGDRKLLMFRDSFANDLFPYLSGYYFKDATYFWREINCALLEKYVEMESPDIVIEERAEQRLPGLAWAPDLNFERATNKAIFESSSNILFELSTTNKPEFQLVQTEPDMNSQVKDIHIIPVASSPGMVFPSIEFQDDSRYMVKMILDVPDECYFRLDFPDENVAYFGIIAGTNEVYIPLEAGKRANKRLSLKFDEATAFDVLEDQHIIEEIEIKVL